MIETNLAQTVNATNDFGSAYDTNVKYLLADKQKERDQLMQDFLILDG